jgi:drug/metabolite transporter (DMT)-like permease
VRASTLGQPLGRHPQAAVFFGALALAFSGILFRLSHTSPETGAFFRCLFALPPLFALMWWEERRWGSRDVRQRRWAWAAGVFFAADLLFWHHAINFVGAGLATVLSNTQVVLVAVLAWLLLSERPARLVLVSIPVVSVGVVLVSGLLESGAYGANPARGAVYGVLTGLSYAAFLLVMRQGQRGVIGPGGPLFDATLSCAVVCLITGLVVGDLDLTPSAASLGWLVLLALLTQVCGWVLVSISLPRLPAAVTSVSLTLQPVCTVLLAAAILGESPSSLQLLGAATILVGLAASSLSRRGAVAEPEIAG